MNEHVQAVINKIEERIAKLQELGRTLRELLNEDQAPATAAAPSGNGTRPKPAARLGAQASRLHNGGPGRKFKVIDAIREVFRKSVGELNAHAVREQISSAHPHLKDKLNCVSVNLMDMSNRGELHRLGKGRDATYRKAKLKDGISAKETQWRQFRESIPTPSTAES